MKVPNVQQNMHLSLGKEGTYTTGGTGELHDANGAKYQTKKDGKCNSESKDEDAIATGIAENDAVGKWIHKVNSTPGNGTRGCIGLLPKDFCLLKEEYTKKKGLKIKVCNSGHESTGVSKWWNKFKYNVKSFNGGKIDDSEHFEEDKKSTAPAAPAAR